MSKSSDAGNKREDRDLNHNLVQENLSFRRIRFKLEAAGFDEVKQLNNHAKFVKRQGSEIFTAVLPHYQEISASVLASILRQARLSKEEFDRL